MYELVFIKLIKHIENDLISYYSDEDKKKKIKQIIELIESDKSKLIKLRNNLDTLIPDTNVDGSWECSYALNVGCIILNYIDYLQKNDIQYFNDSLVLFTDTIDFKSQQLLEKEGLDRPTEEQITNHEIYIFEMKWLKELLFSYGINNYF